MQEIWIPLTLIIIFLFLYIIRPYVKMMRAIDGFAWLPLLAFIGLLALIPAYGFRPETIPLLLYSAVLSIIVFFKHINGDIKFKSFRKRNFAFVIFPLCLLAAAGFTAFYFTPLKDLSISAGGVYPVKLNDYEIRIYLDENDPEPESRPLLVLLPPAFGGLPAIDLTASELRNNGFTVAACAREYGRNPVKWMRLINAFVSGTVSAKANELGRELEERRKEEVLYVLSWLRGNPVLYDGRELGSMFSRDAIFVGAYDAGASALVLLGDSAFGNNGRGLTVSGLIAIESPLWSLYRKESNEIPDLPAGAGWLESVKHGLGRWFQDIKPKKITGFADPNPLSTPLLFLVSDRSREAGVSSGRSEALLKCLTSARGAVLVSADGAGLFDYSDFPVRYPLVTALLRGRLESPWNDLDVPARTAAIITNFAESVLETNGGNKRPFVKRPGL